MRIPVHLAVCVATLACADGSELVDAQPDVDGFSFETAIPGTYTGTESAPSLGTLVAPYEIRLLEPTFESLAIVYTPSDAPEYTKLVLDPAIPDHTVFDRAHLTVPDQTYAEGNTGAATIAFTGTGAFEASDGQTYEARYDGSTGILNLEGSVTTFGNTETLTFLFEPR